MPSQKLVMNILPNLDHDNKDDEEDKVSVEVGVAVPLLLLVETHLDMFTDYDIVREKIDNTIDLADCYLYNIIELD